MKHTLPVRVRLGPFELDLKAGELCRGKLKIILQEQPFQILGMLVERDGELVARDEIQKKLWPNDTVVEFDHSINAAIKKLRQALGDSADEPEVYRDRCPSRLSAAGSGGTDGCGGEGFFGVRPAWTGLGPRAKTGRSGNNSPGIRRSYRQEGFTLPRA